MPKSLADLRAEKRTTRPERSYTACLAPELIAEVQALTEELDRLPQASVVEDEERQGPPRRTGQGENPRAAEIKSRLAELLDQMAEYEGELRIRATKTDGEWRQWVNEHPARDEGEAGHKRDLEVTYGYCNADALIDDLGTYAVGWNGETLDEGDWAMLGVANADKKRIATAVASLYESGLDLPKWRSALSASLRSESDLLSRAASASPQGDSSAGSPKNDTSTTTPTES